MADAWQMLIGIGQASSLVSGSPSKPRGSLPFTLITGFLGAGKTTLIKRLITEPHGVRIAVIVNDFGAVNIDAALIRDRHVDTIDLANGCVCCTLSSGLTRTLIELTGRADPPEHIVLEASGVAEPEGIIHVALSHEALSFNGIVCVVDADAGPAAAQTPAVAQLVARQAASADLIILNKTDMAGPAKVREMHDWLEDAAPRARRLEASYAEVPAAVILGLPERSRLTAQALDTTGPAKFASLVFATQRPIIERRLCDLVENLPSGVLRAKGIVRLSSNPSRAAVLQATGRRWALSKDTNLACPDQSEIVVIGVEGVFDVGDMRERLLACEG
ncbi:MAG: GTP-binding protein [Anaerolineae bacterium]|nr:GTP-binding protein [Anaerolineae bacterium]